MKDEIIDLITKIEKLHIIQKNHAIVAKDFEEHLNETCCTIQIGNFIKIGIYVCHDSVSFEGSIRIMRDSYLHLYPIRYWRGEWKVVGKDDTLTDIDWAAFERHIYDDLRSKTNRIKALQLKHDKQIQRLQNKQQRELQELRSIVV